MIFHDRTLLFIIGKHNITFLFIVELCISNNYIIHSQSTMRFLDTQKDNKNKKKKLTKDSTKKQDQSTYYNVLTPNCKVQCDSCEKDITKYVKITTGENDYCVGCFVNLKEYPETYTAINKLNFPIFDPDWSAEEELLLMEALERHGFGNWKEIAEQIGTDKTPLDIQKHYQEIFMESSKFLPTQKEILTQRDPKTMKLTFPKSAKIQNKRGRKMRQQAQIQSSVANQQRGSLSSSAPNANQTLLNTGNAGQIVGFMPKRGDFEVQYDNEAELLLAQMQFNDDDTQEQKEMKFKILQIYNYRLSERIKRKDFVISRQLLDVKLQSQLQKNRGKQERQIYNSMKVFARFNTPQEHQKLVQGIIRQKQIRQRIQELRHYKKMGLKTLAQVQGHLEQKRKRQQKNKKPKVGENNYIFDKGNKNAASRRTRGNVPEGQASNQKHSSGLSFDENKLCEYVGITPSQYIVVKETLLRESLKNGFIKKDGLDNIFKVDKDKIDGVFDFLVQNGIVLSK